MSINRMDTQIVVHQQEEHTTYAYNNMDISHTYYATSKNLNLKIHMCFFNQVQESSNLINDDTSPKSGSPWGGSNK